MYYKIRNELEFVVVCDLSLECGEEFCVNNGFEKYYVMVEEMFVVEKIDIISICMFNWFYFDNVMLLLVNGVVVMCEKLFVMSVVEVKVMWEFVEEKGVILVYDFYYCFFSEV